MKEAVKREGSYGRTELARGSATGRRKEISQRGSPTGALWGRRQGQLQAQRKYQRREETSRWKSIRGKGGGTFMGERRRQSKGSEKRRGQISLLRI